MKHNLKVTLVLLGMFLVTQLIGIAVIYAYMPIQEEMIINGTLQNVTLNPLPYGMEPPTEIGPGDALTAIVMAMIIAVLLVLLLTKIKAALFLRLWFFLVIIIALGISFNSFLQYLIKQEVSILGAAIPIEWLVALIIALPFAYYKVFKQNLLVHNISELLVYPGIAAVFVPILSLWTIILLLLLISIYDIYAVWHSGFMQKMAKFQINELKVFAGFFVPYLSKKQRQEVKKLKKENPEKLKTKKVKVQLAILGGGDVVFPIITSGIVLMNWGLISALIVSVAATLSLFLLFAYAKKGKFYPAMPFLTAGLFVGMFLGYLVHLVV